MLQTVFDNGSAKNVHHVAQRIGNFYQIIILDGFQIFLVFFFHQIVTKHFLVFAQIGYWTFIVADFESDVKFLYGINLLLHNFI